MTVNTCLINLNVKFLNFQSFLLICLEIVSLARFKDQWKGHYAISLNAKDFHSKFQPMKLFIKVNWEANSNLKGLSQLVVSYFNKFCSANLLEASQI